jgi:hypothetical protein
MYIGFRSRSRSESERVWLCVEDIWDPFMAERGIAFPPLLLGVSSARLVRICQFGIIRVGQINIWVPYQYEKVHETSDDDIYPDR